MSTLNYSLGDVVEKVNAFRTKMIKRGLLQNVNEPDNTIEEMSCRNIGRYSDNILSLGSQGFEDPRINDLIESVSKRINERGYTEEKNQDKVNQESTTDLIRNFHEDTVRKIIEDQFAHIERKVLDNFKQHSLKRWESEKSKFIECIELANNAFSFTSSTFNDQLVNTYPLMLSRSIALNEDEVHFARIVHEYVDEKIMGNHQTYDKLKRFFIQNCSKSSSDGIWELWHLLESVLYETNCDSWNDKVLVKAFLNFLQTEYREYLRRQVSANLANAELGGVPGIYSLVRGYLASCSPMRDTTLLEGPLIEGKPAWQFVYLCLRCGDRKAALKASVSAHLPCLWIQLLEGMDISEEQIRSLYNNPNVTDVFQRACLCLMDSGCDPTNNHSEVVDSIEDFLWMKLNQVYLEGNRCTEDIFNKKLMLLQTQIRDEFGEKYFIESSETSSECIPCPLLYCQCLLLTGQFEYAIELLCRYPKDSLFIHAVHMAIVLYESKLLKVCDNYDNPLLAKGHINLYKIVKTYAEKRFLLSEGHDELVALLDYLYILKPIQCEREHDNVFNGFVHSLGTLKLDESQILKIYGISTTNELTYKRSRALIDNYTQNPNQALMYFADVLDVEAGNCPTLLSAMLRMHSGNFDKAANNVCDLLTLGGFLCIGTTIDHNSNIRNSETLRFTEYLVNVLGEKHPHSLTAYQIALFFNMFNDMKYREAIDLLHQTKIVPFKYDAVDDCVNYFLTLPEQLKHTISDIIEATAVCLQKIHKCTDSINNNDDQNDAFYQPLPQISIKYLREQTDALIRYSEAVPFHIRSNVSRRLLQLCTSCGA